MCWESESARVCNSTLQSPLSLTYLPRTMESSSPTRSSGLWMTPMCTESPSTRQVNLTLWRCHLWLSYCHPLGLCAKMSNLIPFYPCFRPLKVTWPPNQSTEQFSSSTPELDSFSWRSFTLLYGQDKNVLDRSVCRSDFCLHAVILSLVSVLLKAVTHYWVALFLCCSWLSGRLLKKWLPWSDRCLLKSSPNRLLWPGRACWILLRLETPIKTVKGKLAVLKLWKVQHINF